MTTICTQLVLLAGAASAPAPAQETRQAYIVQLAEAPLAAQASRLGARDASGDAARRRADELKARQDAVLALVPDAPVQYRYSAALNGFAAMLTPAEAARLRAHPDVTQVSLVKEEQVDQTGAGARPAMQDRR